MQFEMKAWEEFLHRQVLEIGEASVKKWLRPLRVVRFDAQNLYLEAKDSFQALWFEEHIRKKLDAFCNNNSRKIKVHLTLAGRLPLKSRPKQIEEGAVYKPAFEELNALLTLNRFWTSDANSVTLQIVQEFLSQYNPVFLYGPAGVGKTHLLTALAHLLSEKGLKVTYARADTFTEHVVTAIRASEMRHFREAYRNTDVLILDDVHELAHKAATQEELFHTFNALHLSGKQIFLSSPQSPSQLPFIEPRLISRFEWGIVLQLLPYEKKDLLEILELKCQALKFPLHMKVREWMVDTFKSGPKALVRALEALILRNHALKQTSTTLTVLFIKHQLQDLVEEENKAALTTDKILHQVAEQFGIRVDDILGGSQTRESSLPRQIAMYLCRTSLKLPYKKIGDTFSRDHSTVMTSVKTIEKALQDPHSSIDATLSLILKKL